MEENRDVHSDEGRKDEDERKRERRISDINVSVIRVRPTVIS